MPKATSAMKALSLDLGPTTLPGDRAQCAGRRAHSCFVTWPMDRLSFYISPRAESSARCLIFAWIPFRQKGFGPEGVCAGRWSGAGVWEGLVLGEQGGEVIFLWPGGVKTT